MLKENISENVEKLFIKVGFLKFEILELSKDLNIDSEIIRNCFISKGGLLLSILTELYVEAFALNQSFFNANLPIKIKKEIFMKVLIFHERKIKLFISLIDRKELRYLDAYLLKLLSRTTTLHFRLFLSQFSFDDSNFIKTRRVKYSYYNLFEKFKTMNIEAFKELTKDPLSIKFPSNTRKNIKI
ncbi:hypothetical protein [Chryseobacterium sp. CCH4-E10]|uniref:hypothetical protein n=1 Tax=Chryseobacterium sp. CCH4-E10 TaxID=1768758 RepID=UPI00082FCF64|nr:hypothetical protein [Chryseobacterium sp. CCH4-E10]